MQRTPPITKSKSQWTDESASFFLLLCSPPPFASHPRFAPRSQSLAYLMSFSIQFFFLLPFSRTLAYRTNQQRGNANRLDHFFAPRFGGLHVILAAAVRTGRSRAGDDGSFSRTIDGFFEGLSSFSPGALSLLERFRRDGIVNSKTTRE